MLAGAVAVEQRGLERVIHVSWASGMDAPTPRKPYPTDGGWAFAAPYLTLLDPASPQRRHDLREVFNALR